MGWKMEWEKFIFWFDNMSVFGSWELFHWIERVVSSRKQFLFHSKRILYAQVMIILSINHFVHLCLSTLNYKSMCSLNSSVQSFLTSYLIFFRVHIGFVWEWLGPFESIWERFNSIRRCLGRVGNVVFCVVRFELVLLVSNPLIFPCCIGVDISYYWIIKIIVVYHVLLGTL